MVPKGQDIEKGLTSGIVYSMLPSWTSSAPAETTKHEEFSKQTPLQIFQMLVGIETPATLTHDGVEVNRTTEEGFRRVRNDNIGLYQRAKEQERSSRIAYLCTSYISNTLYMLQILLAATFTALSAYKDTSAVTLTILGAINTVLAGCLAWQKGQGVPQRYRKAQDQYQALILEIEMTERLFFGLEISSGEAKLDPRTERDRLQKMFDIARADQQANYPDLYVSTAAHAGKDVSKELEDAKAESAKMQSDLMVKIEELSDKLAKIHDQTGVAPQSVAKV